MPILPVRREDPAVTVVKTEAAPYIAAFKARRDNREPLWLKQHRAAALDQFAALGFPSRRVEAWRFTDLRPLTKSPILASPEVAGAVESGRDAVEKYGLSRPTYRLVLTNAMAVASLSRAGALPAGVWFGSVSSALESRPDLLRSVFDASDLAGNQPIASLNAALASDGFILAVDPGVVLEGPVEIIHENTGMAAHARCAVFLGIGASATVIESFVGAGAGWSNVVTHIDLAADARLSHIKLQNESDAAVHLAMTRATLARAASYESLVLTLGGRLSREDIQVALVGEAAHFTLNGAYLLGGDQEATIVPFVDHQVAGGTTREMVKGVVGGRAHGVFLGTITVRPGADQTSAQQTNRNLLLNPGASVDTKPELEIYADDVKCSHGATVGDLDEAALFYLQARGIDKVAARQMLAEAFVGDVIDTARLDESLRAHLRRFLQVSLEEMGSVT